MKWTLGVLTSFPLLIWSSNAQYRPLEQTCHLGARVFDNEDGSISFECFCELHGNDRNPNKKGPNRVTIKKSAIGGNKDHCEGMFLNLAASNEYEVFLDGVINDETNELHAEDWSPIVSLPVQKKKNHKRERSDEAKRQRPLDNERGYSGSGTDARFLRSSKRGLQQTTAWSLLVVRVGGVDYAAPTTNEQLIDDWFQDSASLSTQIAECSANKMTFIPRVGHGITGGVMTVILKQKLSGLPVRDVEDLVLEELANHDIVLDPDSLEKIALCLPASSFENDRVYGGHAAYAVPNGNLAVFKGEYCNRISTQMHEIGHTLGLQHSGDLVDTTDPLQGEHLVGDHTGAMGGWHSPDDAEICYNAAKMWQLGWRPTKDIIPGTDEAMSLALTSFADWDRMESTTCIARIVTPDKFLFVHYNRQAGLNADTQEYGDKVIVTSRSSLGGIDSILSQIVAVLDTDDSFAVEDVGRSGFGLMIVVETIALSTAHVSIRFGGHTSPPPSSPSDAQSLLPSHFPTISPSGPPSARQTSLFPTSALSSTPSSFPPPTITSSVQSPVPPTKTPTIVPSSSPSARPSKVPSEHPSVDPVTKSPTNPPTESPTNRPTASPTNQPSNAPSKPATRKPTESPTSRPTRKPTKRPTDRPTNQPSNAPSKPATRKPTESPTSRPTRKPTKRPTDRPTIKPSASPTDAPMIVPQTAPTAAVVPRGCTPREGRYQPECNNNTKQRCQHMIQKEGKCVWTACAGVVVEEEPPPEAPCDICQTAPGQNQPDCNNNAKQRCHHMIEKEGKCFWKTCAGVVVVEEELPPETPCDICQTAPGQNQPECNRYTEQRCQHVIRNEGKCFWKTCVIEEEEEEPLPEAPCDVCETAPGQNQPECNRYTEQRCQHVIRNEGKCFWKTCVVEEEEEPLPEAPCDVCETAPGQNQPECNRYTEQRCKRMIRNEDKCFWNSCS